MPSLPFLKAAKGALVAWQAGRPITVEEFCADVACLAIRLPAGPTVINLCDNRYHFMVGLAAALSRNHVTLLPPSRTAEVLAGCAGSYEGAYCLTDGADVPSGMPRVDWAGAGGRSGEFPLPFYPADRIAVIPFTSGSTGVPLPHPKSWGSLVKNAEIAARRLIPPAFAGGGVAVGTIPHHHMYGLESVIMMPLQAGIAIHADRPFYPDDLRKALLPLPVPLLLVTTPIHLRAYVGEAIPIPHVAMVISATAPLSPALAADAERLLGAPVHEIYGCTESGAIATRHTAETAIWRTYDGVLLDQAEGRVTVYAGHLTEPVVLSDVIELYGPETFELRGRSSDMINIAGKRTSLADLNHQLGQIEGVEDGVFFMPDETEGGPTRLLAFVVAPGLTSEDIRHELRKHIDPVFLPRPLILVDRLPRSETGKLPRAQLIAQAFEQHVHAWGKGERRAWKKP